MLHSLKHFKSSLAELVLDHVWKALAQVGVRSSAHFAVPMIVDPEPLLLLTCEYGRQDPRVFDEVLDWLVRNGRWINISRLNALLLEDKICQSSVVSAVAAFMMEHDETPKWRTLAQRYLPKLGGKPQIFFERDGKPFVQNGQTDETFKKYGWLRSPVFLRGQSAPLGFRRPAELIFKCRALFGVNIRADVFAYLIAHGPRTASRVARDLGYSQRWVLDALGEMEMANACQTQNDGARKEFFIPKAKGWQFFFDDYSEKMEPINFNWRAFGRGACNLWRKISSLKEEGLTDDLFWPMALRAFQEVKPDLLAADLKGQVYERLGKLLLNGPHLKARVV